MGDPKKQRKKYTTPSHPWNRERIERDKLILEEFGLGNKKEIWKMEHILRKFRKQAKNLKTMPDEQAKKEQKQLIDKLVRLSLLQKQATLDDVLSLGLSDILNRRLQTKVFKKGLAKTIKQARQFIVHGHICIGEQKITSPSYLIGTDEEPVIRFKETSKLSDIEHPERINPEKELKKEQIIKKEKKTELNRKEKGKRNKKEK